MKKRAFTITLTLKPNRGSVNYPDASRVYAGLTRLMAKEPEGWTEELGGEPYDLTVVDPEGRTFSFETIKRSWQERR